MFVAFSKVFTPENLLYFAKGAVVSLLLAAVSLLFGIVFGILGSSEKRSIYKIFITYHLHNLLVESILSIFKEWHRYDIGNADWSDIGK